MISRQVREYHRGVPIHLFQTRVRIDGRVKPEIDSVLLLTAPSELFRYCEDARHPPEARLLATALLEVIFTQSRDRRALPGFDIELVRAHTAGIDEKSSWRSPWVYGSLFDVAEPGGQGAERREVALTDEQLEFARRAP